MPPISTVYIELSLESSCLTSNTNHTNPCVEPQPHNKLLHIYAGGVATCASALDAVSLLYPPLVNDTVF